MNFRVVLVRTGEPEDEVQELGQRRVSLHGQEIQIENRRGVLAVPDLAEVVEIGQTVLIDCTGNGERFTVHLTPRR